MGTPSFHHYSGFLVLVFSIVVEQLFSDFRRFYNREQFSVISLGMETIFL